VLNADKLQPLVRLEQQNIALLFANYLHTLGINAAVHPAEQGFAIYCEPTELERAQQLFQEFIAQPYATKYQTAAWQQNNSPTKLVDGDTLLQQFQSHFLAHAGIITLLVFCLCWLIFIASVLGLAQPIFEQLHFFTQLQQQQLLSQPWRILSPALFHFSWLHIVFNTLWWWQLGGEIERTLGKTTLFSLFLCSAIVSNLGQFVTSGANFGGLSGVVYALVGFIWWLSWLVPATGLTIAKPIVAILLGWMLLGFVDLLPVNMANTAHLLGLLSGCGFALLYKWLLAKPA
jgi:GlpG protein